MVEICLAFIQAGSHVTAICPEPERVEAQVRALRPGAAERLQAVSSEGIFERVHGLPLPRRLVTATRNWANVQALLDGLPRALRPECTFFAYVDAFLTRGLAPWMVDSVFTYPWSALYMSPEWMRRGRRYWPELATSPAWCLQADHCESVSLIDEGLSDRLSGLLPDKPVVRLPDFLPSASMQLTPGRSAEILERARGRRIVGVVGSLQSRKGISTLLKLALQHPDAPYFFVFAGKLSLDNFSSEEVDLWQSAAATPPENCYIRTTVIPDEAEYAAVANTCDIFYAAYLQFGNSSNALAWAAWLRKPVIVSAGYLMAERVRAYRLGAVVPEAHEATSWAAIEAIDQQLVANPDLRGYDFERYLEDHSVERLETGVRRISSTFSL